MKRNKIFIACDTKNIKKVKEIIKKTKNSKLKIGYKFGLEFLNSKNGRNFISKLRKKIIFADLKLHDIPNTCASAIKAIKDLKVNYLTIHISSGLKALKAAKAAKAGANETAKNGRAMGEELKKYPKGGRGSARKSSRKSRKSC